MAKKKLSKQNIEDLLTRGVTGKIEGFKSRNYQIHSVIHGLVVFFVRPATGKVIVAKPDNIIHAVSIHLLRKVYGPSHGIIGNETSTLLGTLAVVFATINVIGGYLVTDRMLAMFKKKVSGGPKK